MLHSCGCNKIGSMTCLVGWALDVIFSLQMMHQPIVEGVRCCGCASNLRELLAGQGTPASVIDGVGLGQLRFSRLWICRHVRPERNVSLETPYV